MVNPAFTPDDGVRQFLVHPWLVDVVWDNGRLVALGAFKSQGIHFLASSKIFHWSEPQFPHL